MRSINQCYIFFIHYISFPLCYTKCWKIFPLLCFASLPSDLLPLRQFSLLNSFIWSLHLPLPYLFYALPSVLSSSHCQCKNPILHPLKRVYMYIKYQQSQLEGFHKEILFNIKLYQSSIKASLSLTLHTAPHFSLQFAYLTLKELYGKSKQRFQSRAKISSTFCWKFYSISNPWESLLEHFCSIRKRRTLV